MADPISIVGTVAGLLTLAGTVGKQLKIAHTTFTEAQVVVQSIRNEVESIAMVASDLQGYLSSSSAPYNISDLSALNRFLSETRCTLDAM